MKMRTAQLNCPECGDLQTLEVPRSHNTLMAFRFDREDFVSICSACERPIHMHPSGFLLNDLSHLAWIVLSDDGTPPTYDMPDIPTRWRLVTSVEMLFETYDILRAELDERAVQLLKLSAAEVLGVAAETLWFMECGLSYGQRVLIFRTVGGKESCQINQDRHDALRARLPLQPWNTWVCEDVAAARIRWPEFAPPAASSEPDHAEDFDFRPGVGFSPLALLVVLVLVVLAWFWWS